MTALKNAAMAQSAVVLIGGAAASLTRGRGALQDIDQIGVLQTEIDKLDRKLNRINRRLKALDKAISEKAQTEKS